MPVVAFLKKESGYSKICSVKCALASRSDYRHRQQRRGHVELKRDDGFMFVAGNTHLEATISLVCFVVV